LQNKNKNKEEVKEEKKETKKEEIGFAEENKKTDREILRENKEFVVALKNNGLSLILSRKLVLKFGGKEAVEISKSKDFNSSDLAKLV